MANPLMSFPPLPPGHFSALVLIHPHCVFPAQLPQPSSFLPVGMLLSGCGFSGSAGAWWVQEHPNGRRRLVGSANSCAPTEPPPPCVTAQGHPPNTALPLLLATSPASQGAGTELVGSLPEMGSALTWMCPGDSRDDASVGSSPGSRKTLSPESGNLRFGSATSACIMDR